MATLSNNDIAQAIYLSTQSKGSLELNVVFKNIVKFLSRRNLLSKSELIISNLQKIINRENNVLEVKLSSRHQIDAMTKNNLIQMLKHRYGEKDFVFLESLDDNLLGGFKVEVENELIDLTLKNKISKLKEYLIQNHE